MFVILSVCIIVLLLFLLDRNKRQYWSRKNVPQLEGSFPLLGHFFPIVFQQKTSPELYKLAYDTSINNAYTGIYEFWRPTLVVKDPELIESIMIKNFSSFMDHPSWIFDEKFLVNGSLFMMKGERWRALRYHTIPWFTTGRLKSLFDPVLAAMTIPEQEFEITKFPRSIAADTIAAFFSLVFKNKEELNFESKRMHDVSNYRYYRLLMVEHFANFSERLGLTFTDKENNEYFRSVVKTIFSNKEHSLIQRFRQLIDAKEVKMRKKDLYVHSADEEVYSYEVSEEDFINIIGQFFFAGLDATAYTMSWLLYDLARNPEAQTVAREEIKNCLKKHGGWTYEAVQDMRYLANCVTESARLHPVLAFLFRICTTSHTTSQGLVIDKGTKIIIPTIAIHMDPSIYPQPEEFHPERFSSQKQTDLKWLPFGEGPRKCAGMRFALMVARTFGARILENHKLEFIDDKFNSPVENDTKAFFLRPKNKLYFKLTKLCS